MTRQEIYEEMLVRKAEMNELQNRAMAEKEFAGAMGIFDEMLKVANRISELDTLNKKLLQEEYESRAERLKSKLAGIFARG